MKNSNELPFQKVKIQDAFWGRRLDMNASEAIYHQWEQLEKTKCIDNFRIIAGIKQGFRYGMFFADSDAHKWLDAASRIYATKPDTKLLSIMNEYIQLLKKVQMEDGYLFTYNQFHFPNIRWKNLQIEHELYTMGHLIEAAVSHYSATGNNELLNIAIKVADLIVKEFRQPNPKKTPGHQEIELALLKLYEITKNSDYLKMAEEFIKRRGHIRFFFFHYLKNIFSTIQRTLKIEKQKKAYLGNHPEELSYKVPLMPHSDKPIGIIPRTLYLNASGKYNQQHLPAENQILPEGHAVRYGYFQTAIAKLLLIKENPALLQTLKIAWDNMVQYRMFVSGGIGSIPFVEGFGYHFEIDPFYAYCETCAALSCIFWNWEMTLLTGDSKYSDLLEWQLYNAASSGIALDGKSYFYRNPLASRGQLHREPWYGVPCCPSNISRTWASLGKYIYSYSRESSMNVLWIHQFIGNETEIEELQNLKIMIDSGLPWNSIIKINITIPNKNDNLPLEIKLRIPSWAYRYQYSINGEIQESNVLENNSNTIQTASGYTPYESKYISIKREWKSGDFIELNFPMEIRILKQHSKVKSMKGKVNISRGPILYCLESVDNPDIDIFKEPFDLEHLDEEWKQDLLNGIYIIKGKTKNGKDFIAIPYYAWGNRGQSKMTTYF